jgi:thioredoxin-dependent peroxiredoxin
LPSHGLESDAPASIRNTVMIDPPKATKGRRMSKKSRKKSPKTLPGTRPAAKTMKVSKAEAAKASRTVEASNKKRAGQTSHKAASKPLKSSSAAAPSKPSVTKSRSNSSSVENSPHLVEGATAPAFHLRRDGGGMVALSDYAGKKLVLFFYPRADTPGCTREAIDFTRLRGAFGESGTEVLGISADSQAAQERFRDKHNLRVPLISDEKHQMLEAYGAWGEKSMYGRTFLGILRTTVLIDAEGRIARIWRRVKVDGHADEVLAAARAL